MKKINLNKKQFNSYIKTINKYNLHIFNRVKYILQKIEHTFSCQLEIYDLDYMKYTCEFENMEISGEKLFSYGNFCEFKNIKQNNALTIIDKYNQEVSLIVSFPERWIIENFEKELINGKKLYCEKIIDEKKLENQQIKDNKKLLQSIMKKITQEEKDLLKMILGELNE